MGALGRPTIGHSRPKEAQLPPLYCSVHLSARLVETQLPPIREEAQLPHFYPGMVPVGLGEAKLYVCLLHAGVCATLVVGFSLTNKNPEYKGLLLKFQWSTHFVVELLVCQGLHVFALFYLLHVSYTFLLS